jgi:hypothetical protein
MQVIAAATWWEEEVMKKGYQSHDMLNEFLVTI